MDDTQKRILRDYAIRKRDVRLLHRLIYLELDKLELLIAQDGPPADEPGGVA